MPLNTNKTVFFTFADDVDIVASTQRDLRD